MIKESFQLRYFSPDDSRHEEKISKALNPRFKALQKRADQTKVAYLDKTSLRKESQTCYVWTTQQQKIKTLFGVF